MNFRSNVDLGKAFDHLKNELAICDSIKQSDNDLSYRLAYARLSGTLDGLINAVKEEGIKYIDPVYYQGDPPDDLKNIPVFTTGNPLLDELRISEIF